MIGLDTNLIIASLVEGQKLSFPRNETFRISQVALAEFVWVLKNRLGYQRAAVIDMLNRLMTSSNIVVDRPEVVRAALTAFQQGGAEFPDFMIAHDNRFAGCKTTLTLDKDAGRKPGFTLLRT